MNGRPAPTTWTTRPITPLEVEEIRKSNEQANVEAHVRALKAKFWKLINSDPRRRLTLDIEFTPSVAYQQFARELTETGFEVELHCEGTPLEVKSMTISWSV